MRSTRATAALERLKRRSGDKGFSMVRTAQGGFYLTRLSGAGRVEKLSDPLELDEFVVFVDSLHATPKKLSKFDQAFEKQLKKS